MKGGASRPVRRIRDDRGLILPLALMAFLVLGVLATALLSVGSSEVQIASNHLRNTQADFLAEAGLEHAFSRIWWLWNNQRANLTNASALQAVPGITANTPLGGAGNYTVQYEATGLWTWRVVSTGASAVGGSQQIRRAVMSTFYQSRNAIVANGNLTITGSTIVTPINGQCGNVHSNGDLTLGGNTTINGYAAESNNNVEVNGNDSLPDGTTNYGSVTVAGGINHHAPRQPLPHIDPAALLVDLTNPLLQPQVSPGFSLNNLYQMKANGEVRDGNGGLITTLADGDTFGSCGWTYTAGSPAEWQISGNDFCNGTFYFEGKATVTSSPGSNANPWKTTLIATGDIDVQGRPTIEAGAAYTVYNTLFYSGRDIKINGTPSNGYNGVIAAHEQFELGGNGTFTGFIVGENIPNTNGSLVNANGNIVNGNIGLTYNCGANPPLEGPLQILSWGL